MRVNTAHATEVVPGNAGIELVEGKLILGLTTPSGRCSSIITAPQ
jgi:hypothetical protein